MIRLCIVVAIVVNEDDELTPRKKRRSRNEDNDLWMPGGVKHEMT